MKQIKRTVAALLAAVLGAGAVFTAMAERGEYSQSFTDVEKEHWAFEYISDLVERGALSGYPDGTFKPSGAVTRAEFARMLASVAELDVKRVSASSFADVAPETWYSPYIEAAKDFLNGYGEVYEPSKEAIREEIAVAMVKMNGYDVSDHDVSVLNSKFSDSDEISEDAKKYVAEAVERGLVSGYEDGTLGPQKTVTRAEAASFLWRACAERDRTDVNEPVPTPSPVPSPAPTKSSEDDVFAEPHYFETALAVVQKGAQDYTTEDGDEVEAVQVLHNGKRREKLLFKTGVYSDNSLGVGDVFFFETNRFGMVDKVYLIYDYSEDEFRNLTGREWSSNLWYEGMDNQLAEGYIIEVTDGTIMLAPREAIETGRIDTTADIDDDRSNGVAVFALAEACRVYEYDVLDDNAANTADRFKIKSSVKESNLGRFEAEGESGVYVGADMAKHANYAVVTVEDGEVTQIYTIIK